MTARPLAAALAIVVALAAAPASAAKILIIADSHAVGPFGASLEAELIAKGNTVAMYAVCSASVRWWLLPANKRAKLSICYKIHDYGVTSQAQEGAPATDPGSAADLLKSNPDILIVALGSNGPAGTPAAAEDLLQLPPTTPRCVWVTPPPMPSQLAAIGQLFNDLPVAINRANRSCTIIDSRLYLTASQSTKDHFYGEPAKKWGKGIADLVSP
jgi:hypothetical protein